MIGLRRSFNIPNSNDKLLLIQKVGGCLSSILGIDPTTVKDYVLVITSDDQSYEFIDNPGESDGFESFQGAEQFARAYILENYSELGTDGT